MINSNYNNFGHIPALAFSYCLKYAKMKYFQLLHYSLKTKIPMQQVIQAVINCNFLV